MRRLKTEHSCMKLRMWLSLACRHRREWSHNKMSRTAPSWICSGNQSAVRVQSDVMYNAHGAPTVTSPVQCLHVLCTLRQHWISYQHNGEDATTLKFSFQPNAHVVPKMTFSLQSNAHVAPKMTFSLQSNAHAAPTLTYSALTYSTVCTVRSQYSAHKAPTLTHLLEHIAHSALTYSTVRTVRSQYSAHKAPTLTRLLQHIAHSALTYSTVHTVRSQYSAHKAPTLTHLLEHIAHNALTYSIVRTVLFLRPQCPLYFSTFCAAHSHCCRYFSMQSDVRPQSGSHKFQLRF